MGNMIIVKPLPVAAVAADNPAIMSGVANLLTPDPKEICVGLVGAGVYLINFDMGAPVTIDTLFTGGMRSGSYLYNFSSATGMGTGLVSLYAPFAPTPASPHGFVRLAEPVTSRYFQIGVGDQSAGCYLGLLVLGLAFQPTWNREWDGGRLPIDTGSKVRLLGGGFGLEEGARKAGYAWTFGDLSDTEVDALYELALDRGEGKPLVVVEDPDITAGLYRRIHYGLFDRFERYARRNPRQTRWALSIEQWV